MRKTRRGGVYIAVLGVALLVSAVGLAGIASASLDLQTAELGSDASKADRWARTAIEIALARVESDPAWVNAFPSGTWVEVKAGQDAVLHARLEYDAGSLGSGPTDCVVTGLATAGVAIRAYSVDAEVEMSSASLVSNGSFEDGTGGWTDFFCVLSQSDDRPDTGAWSGHVTDRTSSMSSVATGVVIENGKTYTVEFRFRTANPAGTKVEFSMLEGIVSKGTGSASATDDTWTSVSRDITVSGYAGLLSTTFAIYSRESTHDFWIDSVSITESGASTIAVTLEAGSYRRRVLE